MSDKVTPDWNKIELDYRAGIKSLRQIASEHGIKSDNSIRKRAAKYGWQRDLNNTINDVADEIVRKDTVRNQVRSKSVHSENVRTTQDDRQDFDISEEETIEENAKAIAQVRIAHRRDISRSRDLFVSLMAEIEELTNRDLQQNLTDMLNQFLDEGNISIYDSLAIQKAASIGGRIAQLKSLSDALKTIITLERQAYNMDNVQPIQDPLTALLNRIATGNSSAFRPIADDPEYGEST
ncbi:hypothetical protein KTH93_11600 [Acinetobacter bereziniae]|uniref:hypothetical protein n=1 Tax=Acinetobacter bereziniae TaxID=106648 RepID=UPI0021CEFFC6|nr:hypothetical protein [Acinetobacter bereziniae]MCU4436113.1 hypothetical protein [Acinetobacter bereziniae]